ncbi:2-C-methyl-D-erythritol 2,4-cyclodiphosphate synthase [candidate division KSB1 bacterium]
MRANISKALSVPVEIISIKATTTEKMGFEGKGEGVSAQSVVLLEDK